MPATSQTAVHDEPAAAPSAQTPRTAARSRAQVAASYVGTFVAGICVAAIPLLSLLKQVAEHKDELVAVADLAQRIGWPALVAGIACGLFAWDRRAARADRAEDRATFSEVLTATRRDGQAGLQALGTQIDGALRENAAASRENAQATRELLRRLGVRTTGPSSAESTGPQERLRPGADRGRRTTTETPIVESEVADG